MVLISSFGCASSASCGFCNSTIGSRCFQSQFDGACRTLGGEWNRCRKLTNYFHSHQALIPTQTFTTGVVR